MTKEEMIREIRLSLSHPRGPLGSMEDIEREEGFVPIPWGTAEPILFSAFDWQDGLITLDKPRREIRIVVIKAQIPGTGAFKRLLLYIRRAGYRPVVVSPIGDVMPALMRRWGWVCTYRNDRYGTPCQEWRPE